jgi:hypothetical protein
VNEKETSPESNRNFHPEVVAEVFGVHKRTVFRWVGYGYVTLEDSLIRRDTVLEPLTRWRNSCSLKETRKLLGIGNNATIHSWADSGFLELLDVMGETRVSQVSINALLSRPGYSKSAKKHLKNVSLTDSPPKFASPKHNIASVTVGIDKIATSYRSRPKERVEGYRKHNLRIHTLTSAQKEALHFGENPPRLTSVGSAMTFLGFRNEGMITSLCDRGDLREVIVQGRMFLLAGSVKSYKKRHRSVEERSLELYSPKNTKEKQIAHSMRLATFDAGAHFLGITLSDVRSLLRGGSIFSISVGGKTLLNARSVEEYKARTNGNKGAPSNIVKVQISGKRPSWHGKVEHIPLPTSKLRRPKRRV